LLEYGYSLKYIIRIRRMGNECGRKRKGGKCTNGIKKGTTGFKQREEDEHGRIYVKDGKRT
jgi:hypothetical protein